MRWLPTVPMFLLTLACQDNPLAQTDLDDVLGPQLVQTGAPHGGGVKMVPAKFGGTWWVAGFDFTGCSGDESLYSVYLEGSGKGTHMGQYQAAWTVCWGYDGSFVSSAGAMTAANGDLVGFFGSAAQGTTHPFYPDGTWELLNGYFDGGTGRFEHAEGWYDCTGTYNETVTGGTMSCEGMISSVGSSK